jgi:heme/copper-type cytochrome/quinol oxidase subunit 2
MIWRSTRRRSWLILAVALLAAAYAWSGVAMNASFAVAAATPADEANHRHAVYAFLAVFILCVAVAGSAVVSLWRERRRSRQAT